MRLPSLVLTLLLGHAAAAAAAASDAAAPDAAASSAALDPPALQPLVQRANAQLAAGHFGDAARTYSEAIDHAPAAYLLYFKRATALLSLGRHTPALADYDKALALTGGAFDAALLAKGRVFAKEGRWADAREAATAYSRKHAADRDAGDLLFAISEAEVAAKTAAQAQRAAQWAACTDAAGKALQTATHATALRQQRADCALALGDVDQAVADITRLTHLAAPSSPRLLRLAALSYFLLPPGPQARAALKQCLHYDPDARACAAAHRALKALDADFAALDARAAAADWRGAATAGEALAPAFDAALAAAFDAAADPAAALPAGIEPRTRSPRRRALHATLCRAHGARGAHRTAEPWCAGVLRMDGGAEDVDALRGVGEACLAREEWEDAVRHLERAFEAGGRSNQEVHARLQKAQRLLKQSKKKDYYKVLSVARDADARTIKKAYRTAAKTAHPDKGGSEARMAAVNEAYEVLSNPELRARFDNGDDPNDPAGAQAPPFFHGGGHPFQHVFFQDGGPFAHGGGGFKFAFSRG